MVACGTPENVVQQYEAGAITHTGRILKGVLEAAPHVERTRFDPQAALRARVGDMDIAAVGKEAKLPWEENGPKWHIHDRVTTTGKPIKWEGNAVEWVVEQVQTLGTFSETNWNHRSVVEIPLAKKSDGWFLHAMSGHEAYVKFVFRLPGQTSSRKINFSAKLGLKPLSDTPGLEGYSRDSNRVEIAHGPGVQHVVIVVHKKAEIETPAFREFISACTD